MTRFNLVKPPMDVTDLIEELHQHIVQNYILSTNAYDIGHEYNVIAIVGDSLDNPLIFFNPRIIYYSEDVVLLEESFSNVPGLFVKIKRPRTIKIRATSSMNETETHTFSGITARLIQHEMDKLEDINPMQRANVFHKEQAFRQYKKRKRMLDKQR